nr:hypothetical protein Hi04_10k_c3883_00019 [uncultured bacterium]
MSGRCALCSSSDLSVFLERPDVPVHQNLPLESRAAALSVTRGDLRLACCRRCGFVMNTAFDSGLLAYGAAYENDQTFSAEFDHHVDTLLSALVDDGAREKFIVEIGCGRGQFLRRLCELGRNRATGFDPSYVGPDTVDDERVTFVRDYYGPKYQNVRPDIVVCRHVIEHVAAPLELLGAVRAALGGTRADAAFETPTVAWILENLVIQDFFYEHCSYFTADTLAYAFRLAGFAPKDVREVFGGQYLWLRATFEPSVTPDVGCPPSARILALASRFRDHEEKRVTELRQRLERLRESGCVAVWGAGAKGATYVHLLDPHGDLVDCVIDINPRKQGRFLPATGHPIVAPDKIGERNIRSIIVMNANYANEIRTDVRNLGFEVSIYAEGEM